MAAEARTDTSSTARFPADDAQIDQLKELLRSTPQDLDIERIRIMQEVYEDTAGEQQILRRAKFLAAVLDRKKLYIYDNLFAGAMAGKLNAIYTHPEWNVEWMKQEKTVENSPTPEDKNVIDYELLSYHRFGLGKYELDDFKTPSNEVIAQLQTIIDEAFGRSGEAAVEN